MTLDSLLANDFVAVNLGAGGDADHLLPPALLKCLTVVEIDQADASKTQSLYHRKVSLQRAVAGSVGKRRFRHNAFVGCSSLLPPNEEMIRFFGLEELFTKVSEHEVETATLPELLAAEGIGHIDFLKTDIEGVDFEVIQSCEKLLPGISALQCELRFEPFYHGEPPLHEVVAYLAARGFKLIGIQAEHWKPATPRQRSYADGVAAWADCQFVNTRPTGPDPARALVKQVIALTLIGRRALADALVERERAKLPPALVAELIALLQTPPPARSQPSVLRQTLRKWRQQLSGRESQWDFVVKP